ncbi:MAG: coiled-coil protein [Candidatus Bathyarchaeaceae archaeon]
MSESLKERIEDLDHELTILKEERDKLNSEAQKWAEKRNSIHEQIKKLRMEVDALKEKREAINEKVREFKSLREYAKEKQRETHAQILKLKENMKSLMEKAPQLDTRNIQREIEDLEWKIQTTSLTVKEEKPLIDQVRHLEKQLLIQKQIEKSKEKLMELGTEKKARETEAKTYHEKLSELAKQSQKIHEEMLKTLNKARILKVEADNAHQKYVEIKKQARSLHDKCVELLGQIKTFRQEIREKEEKEQAKRGRELRKELEERALEKLKRGEKLTWEEFKILAEKGII